MLYQTERAELLRN